METARQRPRQHRRPAHPRPRRSGRRARAVRGRARPRGRRRLPRHRPARAGAPRHRADRPRAPRRRQGRRARAGDAGAGRRPARQRFGVEAIVDWSAVIDDTPISDAELARVEAAGARLLHTGNRWVRIDPAGLRRARTVLSEHRRDARVARRRRAPAAGERERGPTPTHRSSSATTDRRLGDEHVDERLDGTDGWVDDLLAGLPDERLEEVHEAGTFKGELRHYQRRGLAWMQFLARLGLGGCLADDMGLGKTATTLAHLVERPGPHLVVCPLSVVHNWEAESARFTPVAARRRPPRRRTSTQRAGAVRARRRRPRRHHLRPARPRPRLARRRSSGPRSCSTRRR